MYIDTSINMTTITSASTISDMKPLLDKHVKNDIEKYRSRDRYKHMYKNSTRP